MSDDVIGDILIREGGATVTNNPHDAGGRTQYGISERSHPEAWVDGKVTEAEAREIYYKKYVKQPKFDLIPDDYKALRTQLIDYGVNSGPMLAIQKLQKIVKTPVDGVMGPATLQAILGFHPNELNNLLMAERVKMIGQIVHNRPSQVIFLNGWLNRALEFLA